MKKILFIGTCSILLFGCNINPSKEARIQKLETEIQQAMDKINKLENTIKTLVIKNEQLTVRVLEVEERNID